MGNADTPIYDQTMTKLGYAATGDHAGEGPDTIEDPAAGRHRRDRHDPSDDAATTQSGSTTTADRSGKPGQ